MITKFKLKMGIVVAKLLRLGKDGDKYKKDLVAKVERTNAKLDEDYIKLFNANWRRSGRLYVIDKEKTAARNKALSPEPTEREALKAKADEMGIKYAKNVSVKKLRELIGE